MALVTFKLAPLKLTDSLSPDFSISGFMPDTSPKNIDQATTVLIVDVDEAQYPGNTVHTFSPGTIVFCTQKNPKLYIPLVCYDERMGTRSPRFHLYDLSTEAKVASVENLSATGWDVMPPFSVFSPGAFQTKITFDMPQIFGKLYKLNIGVWDTETNKRVDCDPLVGNDPP